MDSDKHDLTALNLSSSNKICIDIQNEESAKRREALARRPSYRKILNDLSSTSEEFIHSSVTAAAGNPPYEEDNNHKFLKNISPVPYTGGNHGGGGRKRGGIVRAGKNESGGVKRRLNNFTLAAANNDENVVVENSTTPLMTFSSPTYKDYPEPILRPEKFSPPPSNKNHRQEQQYLSDHHQFLPLPPSYLTPERKWLSTPSIFNSVGPNGRNDYSGAAYTPDHVHPSGSSPPPDYVNASGGGTPSSSSSFYLNVNHQRRSHHHHQTLEALSRSPQSSSNLSDYHQLQHYGNVVNQSQQHDSITSEVGLQPFINEAASYGSPPRKHLQQQFLNSSPHPNHLLSPSVTDFRFPAHVISTPFENNNEQQLQQHQRKVAQFSSPQQHSTPPLSTQRFKEEFYNQPAAPPPDNATTGYNNPPYAGGGTVSASFPPAAAAAYQHILQRQLLYHQLAAAASLYPHPHLHHHPVGSAVTGLFAAPPSLTPQTLGVRAALAANGSSDISKFPTPSPSEGGITHTDTPAKGIIFPERLLSLSNNTFPPSPTSHNYNHPHHPPLYHHPSPVSPPLPVYVKREPPQEFEPTATVRPPSIPVSSNSFPYPTPTAAPQHTQPPPMNNSRVPVVLFNNNNRKSASPLTTITTTLNHNSSSHRNRHNRSGESNHSNNATNSTHSSYSSSRSHTTPRSLKSSPHPTTTTTTKQTPYSSHQGYTGLVNDSFGNDSLVGRPHDLSSQRTHHQSHYTEITGPAGTYSENFGGNNCNKQLNSGIAKTDHYEYSLSPNNNLLSGNVSSFSGLPSSSFLISPLQQHNTAGSLFTTQIGDTASASAVLGYNPNSSSTSNTYLEGSGSHHPHHHPLVEEAARKREVRLLKNREAAKECRRKKKEYVKCLENRVAVLENQNKALIEELKALKELYCLKQE